MVSILAHAQSLVYTLLSLMPSVYQQENLEAMLGLFLSAQGYPLPEHSKSKSASALSRFLNIYNWSTRGVVRTTRNRIIKEILSECSKGRKPFLQVIIDLTTLEKCGKFKRFQDLIRVYNRKRGLHIVVMYLVVGKWRVPWSFRVWRFLENMRKRGNLGGPRCPFSPRFTVYPPCRRAHTSSCDVHTDWLREFFPYNQRFSGTRSLSLDDIVFRFLYIGTQGLFIYTRSIYKFT